MVFFISGVQYVGCMMNDERMVRDKGEEGKRKGGENIHSSMFPRCITVISCSFFWGDTFAETEGWKTHC